MSSLNEILALTRSYNKSDSTAFATWQKSGVTRFLLADDGELQLPNATASGQGLLLGGDAEIYRSAASTLTMPAFVASANIDINTHIFTNVFEFWRALLREFAHGSWFGINATEVVSGSGATEIVDDEIFVHTGATHASTAGRYYPTHFISTANPNGINWNKKLHLTFSIIWRGTLATNLTIRAQLTQANTIGNLAAHGLGIQTNGANVNLATFGTGGSQILVSTATDLVDDVRANIHIEHDPASGDRLYINGVLKATQSTAASIPSTEPASTYYLFISVARSGGADTGDEGIRFSEISWSQEF